MLQNNLSPLSSPPSPLFEGGRPVPYRSVGKARSRPIQTCLRRIWEANYIGWPGLALSWQRTLAEMVSELDAKQGTQ